MPVIDTRQEQDRLNWLDRYDLLDTPAEEAFDRITRLACRVLKVPIATVTFLDGHRQWFKSRQGLEESEGARGPALCDVVIRQDAALVVPDTMADDRFAQNPLVVGSPHIRFYAGMPLRGPEGHIIGTFCAMDRQPRDFGADDLASLADLAQMVVSELELRRLAATDGLTGAMSRRAFHEDAARALALAVRHRHELSCLAFDFDGFDAINGSQGRAGGDRILSESIAACRLHLRQTDLIGRTGADAFAVLLPHTGGVAALAVAEKLRGALAAQVFAAQVFAGPAALRVTASFGVASLGHASRDIDAVLQHADEALQAAKAAGRNRCLPWVQKDEAMPPGGRRVLKAGQIVFNAGNSAIDCTVRRLSDQGASIAVISSADIPQRFKLRIEADNISRLCRVVGKSDRQVEVEFE